VLEDRNGFEIALDQTQVNEMITNANAPQKLIILHSNSIKSTQFFESSFPVIFVNSNRAYHERVEIFLRYGMNFSYVR
jgi:hypothetical protein